jgi:hypothetical protein
MGMRSLQGKELMLRREMVSNGEKGDFAAISAVPFCSFDRKEVIKTGRHIRHP